MTSHCWRRLTTADRDVRPWLVHVSSKVGKLWTLCEKAAHHNDSLSSTMMTDWFQTIFLDCQEAPLLSVRFSARSSTLLSVWPSYSAAVCFPLIWTALYFTNTRCHWPSPEKASLLIHKLFTTIFIVIFISSQAPHVLSVSGSLLSTTQDQHREMATLVELIVQIDLLWTPTETTVH